MVSIKYKYYKSGINSVCNVLCVCNVLRFVRYFDFHRGLTDRLYIRLYSKIGLAPHSIVYTPPLYATELRPSMEPPPSLSSVCKGETTPPPLAPSELRCEQVKSSRTLQNDLDMSERFAQHRRL